MSLLDNQFEFIYQTKQPLSEISNMPYWKFEQFIKRLNKKNEELEAQRKKQDEASKSEGSGSNMSKMNPKNFMNGFKIPKF